MSPSDSLRGFFPDDLFNTREETLHLQATLSPVDAMPLRNGQVPFRRSTSCLAPSRSRSTILRHDPVSEIRNVESPVLRYEITSNLSKDMDQLAFPTTEEGERVCDACKDSGPSRSYRNVCDYRYCSDCWKKQLPHRNNGKAFGAIPHERTRRMLRTKFEAC